MLKLLDHWYTYQHFSGLDRVWEVAKIRGMGLIPTQNLISTVLIQSMKQDLLSILKTGKYSGIPHLRK